MIMTSKEKEKLFNYIRDIEVNTKEIVRDELDKERRETKILNKKTKISNMITVTKEDE
jgi:hypothetical protein